MARIQTYNNDVDIENADKLVGTDGTIGVNLNKTKNLTLGDIKTFVNLGNTLNSVLTNGNTSLLNAKIGELYLYDTTELQYGKIKINDSEYNLYNSSGDIITTISSIGAIFRSNAYYGFLNVPNTITANRTYEFPNQSGVVALTSDIPAAPTLQEVTTAGNTTNQTINIVDYVGNEGLKIDVVDSIGLKVNILGNGSGINVTCLGSGEEPGINVDVDTSIGIRAHADNNSGGYFTSDFSAGPAVYASSTGNVGIQGSGEAGGGVFTSVDSIGVSGSSQTDYGVYGASTDGTGGYFVGNNDAGVVGVSSGGSGVYGQSANNIAVYGVSIDGTGGYFTSTGGTAVYAVSIENAGVSGVSQDNVGGFFTSQENYSLIAAQSAAKPGGGSWSVFSDSRIKENVTPYTKGLAEILLINSVTYEYNGLAGTTKGAKFTGIIAQEIKEVFPETVNTYKAKLNEEDEEKTELYDFNASDLTFALINAVKELSAKIAVLENK